MQILRAAFLVPIILCVSSLARAHEWVDVSGKFKIEADFVALRGANVILEKKDGSVISVPLEKLRQADREVAKKLAAGSKPADEKAIPAEESPFKSLAPDGGTRAPAAGAELQLAERVLEHFKKACYRCHGEDGASEGGFNFVSDLDKLARTIAKPKDVAGSQLLQRIKSKTDAVMPPVGEDPRLSAKEIEEIELWIASGSPAPPSKLNRQFVTNDQVVSTIAEDIHKQGERSRRFMRYFTLTHLYNAGVSDEELQTYRNAFTKLINSLSWNTDLVKPREIDAAKTIYAIDMRDLHWNTEMWQSIEGANPYFLKLGTPAFIACTDDAQTAMPYVRIDWFVFAASKPPLYHSLLNLPKTDAELESLLRVNVEANIDQEQAIRAAFNRSGVSQNNRLIEWHKSPYGSYWKSYDFGGSTGRQNLFQHPLGPGGGASAFQHDGGEIIFTLPNGLQGYLLVDEKGKRIDQGPTNIVSDPKRPDKTVTNGVSCMSCHYTGVIAKKDEVGDAVRANRAAFKEANDILALYRESKDLEAIFAKDGERFAKSLTGIGISNLSRSGEPISAMAARFDQEIDLPQVACEFGLGIDDFRERLTKAERVGRAFSSLLIPGGTIKRDVFKAMFTEATVDLRLTVDVSVRATVRRNAESDNPSRPSNVGGVGRGKGMAAMEGEGAEVAQFGDITWGVKSLAFSPNNALLAVGKPDSELMLFDVPQKSRLTSVPKLETLGAIDTCIFTADGSKLLVGGYSGQINVYSVSDEGMLMEVGQFAGHSSDITSMAVSDDGKLAISGEQKKHARVWEIETGTEVANITGFEGQVKAVHLTPDGKLALATDGATLIEYDLKKNEVKRRRPLTRSWAAGQAAAISPDGEMIAVGDSYNIRLWNLKTGAEGKPLISNDIQWSMAFTPDGTRLVSGANGAVNVWDVKKHSRLYIQALSGTGYVQSIAVSADGKFFAAPGSSASKLQVFRFTK